MVRRPRIEQMSGKLLADRSVRRRQSELAQFDLLRRPREVERTPRGVRIMVSIGELERFSRQGRSYVRPR